MDGATLRTAPGRSFLGDMYPNEVRKNKHGKSDPKQFPSSFLVVLIYNT